MKKFIYILFTIALVGSFGSCTEDHLEPTLEQAKAVETSINKLEDVEAVLRGAYNRMTATAYYGRDMIIYGEVRADNCFANANSGRFLTVAAMDMGDSDAHPRDTWTQIYAAIASANIIIALEGNTEIEGDADALNHLIGQAYAIRALGHFDLLKLFGQQHVGGSTKGIPYMKVYKGEDNAPARNTVAEVKQFAYEDLDKAIALMDATLNDPSRQFITNWAAYAIKSRIATYFGDWSEVVAASEAVMNSGAYSIIPQANFVGSWGSDDAAMKVNTIFELAFSSTDNQNINGLSQIFRGGAYGDIRVLADLQSIYDAGDVRGSAAMIGMELGFLTNLGKYPQNDYSDDIAILRYEEVVLNYAEALLNGAAGTLGYTALTALNLVPAQRGAAAYVTATEDNILLERRKEFCFEGLRFDDLARTGRNIPVVDATLQTHGGPAYGSYKYAFPIPKVELNANGNIEQNDGY